MDKEKKDKKQVADNQENFILKKIRYYQGSIKDYETFWNEKIAEGEREESPETKAFAKTNAELNKSYEIVPVEKDDTTMCTDVTSGEGEKEVEKKEDKKEEKEEKKEKKEEKKVEEEEEKVEDAKKEEKGEDDDDKKKSKKKDKED